MKVMLSRQNICSFTLVVSTDYSYAFVVLKSNVCACETFLEMCRKTALAASLGLFSVKVDLDRVGSMVYQG